MTAAELSEIYEAYLQCLNRQEWDRLTNFVAENVEHNGRPFGLAGYHAMLVQDYRDIPDLHFKAETVLCQPPMVAARLKFNCSPCGEFLGLPVNGRKVSFAEHVFYKFERGKIRSVWSILDKLAIEQALRI